MQKLIAPKEEEAPKRPNPFGGAAGGGMSFLDELKAKKAAVEGGGGPAAMSFLDELKAKKAAAAGGSAEGGTAAPKSFLDQIKGFGKSKSGEAGAPATETVGAAPPKKNLMSGMPNLGFLDMIKARRID